MKNEKKGMLIVVMIVLAIILVAVSGFAGYYIANKASNKVSDKTPVNNNEQKNTEVTQKVQEKNEMEEKLIGALKEYTESKENTEKYKISVENGEILIAKEDKTYKVNYEITKDNATFTLTTPMKQGMTYEEYQEKSKNITDLSAIGFMGIAKANGVNFENANTYLAMCILQSLSGKTIDIQFAAEESEFQEKTMDFINEVYKEKTVFEDGSDEGAADAFKMTIEKKDETETSCNIVSTMTVNLKADYSKINEFYTRYQEMMNGGVE